MIYLITGGARSGKSRLAENIAKDFGKQICYIATAIPFDDGMRDRIKKHRSERPKSWSTIELYRDIANVIKSQRNLYEGYLLDCVTLMITNLLFDQVNDFDHISHDELDRVEASIQAEFINLLNELESTGENFIFVTNELGSGIVPENRMSRIFRDIAGRINQLIAEKADCVTLVVCGQSIKIKG